MAEGQRPSEPGSPRVERFDHYMERCLYGPDGFYRAAGSAGRQGDFITSPEVGPLFGAVLARAVVRWWSAVGCPEPFTVVDAGCGPGTLLRTLKKAIESPAGSNESSVVHAAPSVSSPWRFLGIDRAPKPGLADSLARVGIDFDSGLPDDLTNSVVFGNEILDNMPCRIVVTDPPAHSPDGPTIGCREVFVESFDGQVREVLVPLEPGTHQPPWPPSMSPGDFEPGTRIPIFEEASRWVGDVLARKPLALCVFDYGEPTTVELTRRGRWLRTYRHHRRGSNPYADPGRSDITTDIGFDQVRPPNWLGRQRDFLTAWGIDDLIDDGRRRWADRAHAPNLEALMMRSRVTEGPALLDPSGLGHWMTAVWLNSDKLSPVPVPER